MVACGHSVHVRTAEPYDSKWGTRFSESSMPVVHMLLFLLYVYNHGFCFSCQTVCQCQRTDGRPLQRAQSDCLPGPAPLPRPQTIRSRCVANCSASRAIFSEGTQGRSPRPALKATRCSCSCMALPWPWLGPSSTTQPRRRQ